MGKFVRKRTKAKDILRVVLGLEFTVVKTATS